jgi:GNAT superfamily N-acetyltransferase
MQANKGVSFCLRVLLVGRGVAGLACGAKAMGQLHDILGTEIRLAVAGDIPAIRAIAEAAYRPYVARNGLEPAPLHEDYAARARDGQLWVLLEDLAADGSGHQRPCGFLVLIEQGDHLLLDNVAVDPAAHGRGYGRALLDFAEGYASWASLPAIRLYTQEIMVENIAIYSRRGYVETHRATEHGLHRIYMEKRL